MATHSSVLAWRIPGTGEPDGLLSMGSHRVGHDCSNLAAAAALLFILVYKMTENHKTWFPNCNSLECKSRSVVFDSLRPHGLYSPWNSPGQNTGVGSLSLLQAIFPIQGLNPGLPHCRRILNQLGHKGSPIAHT